MSDHFISQRARKHARKFDIAALSLALGLALAVLDLGASRHPGAAAMPDKNTFATSPVITQTYVIFASGPSGNNTSVLLSGSSSGPDSLEIVDGGIYAGDRGYLQNIVVTGTVAPPIDIVGGCTGPCTIDGNFIANFNAAPLPTPQLYDVSDYAPGGQYAQESGWFPGCVAPDGCGNYHYYTSTVSFSGTLLNGLYYVEGNVVLRNVSGNGSIVTPGYIQIIGSAVLTTFDQGFPLLFTTSYNTGNGAIRSNNPFLDLNGNLYAPDGSIGISGAVGQMHSAIYAKVVVLLSSRLTITCPMCDIPALSLSKSVTPTINVPYHGVVTYTVILRNTDALSDTGALMTDTLPAGVTFGQWLEQPPAGLIQNGDAITWTGIMSASAGITFTFTATHTGDYGDVITNTAYFSGETHIGSDDATFLVLPINYTLTIATAGNGSGVVTPTVGTHLYPSGTVVMLQATANPGSAFAGWSGATDCATGQVTIDVDKTCTATFLIDRIYLPLVNR